MTKSDYRLCTIHNDYVNDLVSGTESNNGFYAKPNEYWEEIVFKSDTGKRYYAKEVQEEFYYFEKDTN